MFICLGLGLGAAIKCDTFSYPLAMPFQGGLHSQFSIFDAPYSPGKCWSVSSERYHVALCFHAASSHVGINKLTPDLAKGACLDAYQGFDLTCSSEVVQTLD